LPWTRRYRAEGLVRGNVVNDTGNPIMIPVGQETLGRIIDVAEDPTDKRQAILAEAPAFEDMSVEQEILVTGIKVVDLLAPYAKGGKIGMVGMNKPPGARARVALTGLTWQIISVIRKARMCFSSLTTSLGSLRLGLRSLPCWAVFPLLWGTSPPKPLTWAACRRGSPPPTRGPSLLCKLFMSLLMT